MVQFIFKSFLIFIILIFSGCVQNTYSYPDKSEPYALINIANDEKHMAGKGPFKHRAIHVYRINDKHGGHHFFEVKQIKVKPGYIKLSIMEDNLKLPRVYEGELSFMAKKGEKYLLTSKHIIENGIVDVVFMIFNTNNELIAHN